MAKKKTTAKKAETTIVNPVQIARQAWLATIGGYAKAFEDARERLEEARGRAKEFTARREELMKELVGKGEEVETMAEESFKEARTNVVKFAEPRIEKIRALIPTRAEKADKVGELEAEIEKLNKKIATLTKKVGTTTVTKPAAAKKPAARKAPVKKAAPKTAAKPAAAKPAATKPAAAPAEKTAA